MTVWVRCSKTRILNVDPRDFHGEVEDIELQLWEHLDETDSSVDWHSEDVRTAALEIHDERKSIKKADG